MCNSVKCDKDDNAVFTSVQLINKDNNGISVL